jgi:hypothetical protein
MNVKDLLDELSLYPESAEICDEYGQSLSNSNLFQAYESGEVQFFVQLYFGGSELDREDEPSYTDPTNFREF